MSYILFFAFVFFILWMIVDYIDSRDAHTLSVCDKIEKKTLPFRPIIQLFLLGLGFVFLISTAPILISFVL